MRYINIEFPKFTFPLHFLSYFFFFLQSTHDIFRICGKKSYRDMSLDKFTIDMLPLTRQNILADGGDYFANITFKLNRFFTCFHGRLYADKFLEFLQVSCDPSIHSVQIFLFFLQLHEFHDHTRSLSSANMQADRLRIYILVYR